MNKVHLLKFSLILAIMGMMSSSCSQKEYAVKNRIDTLEYNGKEKYRPKQEYIDYTYHTFQTKDDCRLYVKEIGEGTPIVFLHGGWGHNFSYMTNYFVNQIALHENHRLIFYDQRGSMRSPCRDINSVSVRSHVKDLEFIRQKLKIDSFKIIAHSMGSYLAFKYLSRHPKKVNGFLGIGAVALKGDLFGNAEKKNQFRSDVLESDKFKKVMKKHDLKFENRYDYSDKKKSLINQLASAAANVYDSSKWYCHEGSFTFDQKIAQQTALTMGRWFDHNIRFLDILRLKVFNMGWDFTSTINDLGFEPYYITGDYDFINKLSGGVLKGLKKTKSGRPKFRKSRLEL